MFAMPTVLSYFVALYLPAAVPYHPPLRSVISTYETGVKAVESGQWDQAIASLSRAAGNDPTSRQYIEGVFRDNYFPQFYLSVAYANKGELDKAKLFYDVRGNVPERVTKQFTPSVKQIQK
ncbi:MAG TPA: hypothetical protein VIW45_11805 [Vicinamibacterales bacterium]|jgi:hypothetical protein